MLSQLWAWFVGLFTVERVGILFVLLFKSGISAIAKDIADRDLQSKALAFVRELALREDLTNGEKAKLFNEKMISYAKTLGRELAESVVNCLRELAVNALKAQCGR